MPYESKQQQDNSNDYTRSFESHHSQNYGQFNPEALSPTTLQRFMESDKDFDQLFDSNLDNVMISNGHQFASNNPWLMQHLKPQHQNNMVDTSSIPSQDTMKNDMSRQYTAPYLSDYGSDGYGNMDSHDYQDILLSDPSFLQQQQTLQDHQRRMQEQIMAQEQFLDVGSTQQYGVSPPVSNLSAMFNHTEHSTSPVSHGRSPSRTDQREKRLSQPVQGGVRITFDQPTSSSGSHNRDLAERRGSPSLSLGSFPSRAAPLSSGSLTSPVDHQKRQGDFQARFKVNYARKASLNSQQQAQAQSMLQPTTHGSLQDAPTFRNPFASLPTTPADVNNDIPNPLDDMLSERRRSISLPPSAANNRVPMPGTPPPPKANPIPIERVSRPQVASMSMDAEEHHRRLDEQLQKVNFDDITVSELKEMLRQRGKPATGKKATLIQRLMDERDLVNAQRNGVAIPRSNPSSFTAGSPINSSSVPNSSPVIGSPFSQIQKSIANMSIGSPPMSAHSRRFSPYGAPKSPRLAPSQGSPKQLSTSVPSGFHSNYRSHHPQHHHHTNSNQFIRHNQHASLYAPFVPSGLGTPDTELEANPFDVAIEEQGQYNLPNDHNKNYQDQMIESFSPNVSGDSNFTSNLHDLLQQGYVPDSISDSGMDNQYVPQQTVDQLFGGMPELSFENSGSIDLGLNRDGDDSFDSFLKWN
ncbi:hypothetical protein NQZ79_g429 [Umbelopsis isabellina]|nr:hypothetical protein NQZ79_g429 [Umbelopsis isabellina]